MSRDTEFLLKKIIAHRGVHNLKIEENTISSFEEAIKKKYIIELDVHILSDGEIIVYHDKNLKRLFGINKELKNCTLTELRKIKFPNSKENIPTFQEVLNLVDGKVPLLIELKSDNKTGLLEERVMSILKKYKGKYAIQTFNYKSLVYLKKHYPEVIRGQIISHRKKKKLNFFKNIFIESMIFNYITKPDFVSYNIKNISNNKIKKLKKKYIILGWLISDKKTYDIFIEKYNSLICDKFI